MKQFLTGMLTALLAVAVYSCTTGAGGGGNAVLFKANGRNISADEFFADTSIRQAVTRFVFFDSMRAEAKKANAKIDEKELQQTVDDIKKNVTMGGQSWEETLEMQGMTEKEFVDQQRERMLFDALILSRIEVTDEEIKKVWEDDKDTLIAQYVAENKLPDSEKAKVTFEQVKDLAKERVQENKKQLVQGEVQGDVMLNARLELTSVKDQAKAKRIAKQILKPLKEGGEEMRQQSREARRAAGEDVPDEEPAADDAAAGDDAASADGGDDAAEGEAVPHDHDGDGVSDHGDEAHEDGGEAAPEGEGEGGGE